MNLFDYLDRRAERRAKAQPRSWIDPRLFIATLVIGLFSWALSADPDDATMKGALIAGFAGAWGYYLGSSRGASEANARADKTLDLAAAALPSPDVPQPVKVMNPPSQPVPVDTAADAGELPESERLS